MNVVTLDCTVSTRDGSVRVISDKMVAANLVVPHEKGRAYLDCVAFNGVGEKLARFGAGDGIRVTGRLDSNKSQSSNRWFLRFVADSVEPIQVPEQPAEVEPQLAVA